MKKDIFIIFFLGLFPIYHLYADRSCSFNLRKVSVLLINNKTLTGYICWNESWYSPYLKVWEVNPGIKFPQTVFDYHKNEKIPISLMKRVYFIAYTKTLATSQKDTFSIDINKVKRIIALPSEYSKTEYIYNIPIVSKKASRLINKSPFAATKKVDGCTDYYLLSYNKKIGTVNLKRIEDCLCNYTPSVLDSMNIVFLELMCD